MNIFATAVVLLHVFVWIYLFHPVLCGEDAELQMAFVVYRHGERIFERDEIYPTDNYTVDDFFPLTYGQITKLSDLHLKALSHKLLFSLKEGKLRQYALGKKLRKRYLKFVGDYYSPDETISYSTDWDRTKMGALLLSAGLFPPNEMEVWTDELRWQPVPYHFKPFDLDYIIRRPDHYCPAYVAELERVLNSEEAQEIIGSYKNIITHIENSTGKNMSSLHEVFRIYQNLYAKDALNLPLPHWAKDVFPEPLHTVASYQCVFENYNDKLKRLNGGRMLQKFIESMQLKLNGTIVPKRLKLLLYSAHENDIVKMLSVFRLYKQHLPPYCSAFILELYKRHSDQKFGVKVFYDKSTYNETVEELLIPGCSSFCILEEFIDLIQPLIPINYTKECESPIYLD